MNIKKSQKDLQSGSHLAITYCSLWRRLLVILYDSIAALAIVFLVTAIWVGLNSGQAITSNTGVYPIYLFTLWFAVWLYLAISWRRAGQTLGMRAWRVHLLTNDGHVISWAASFLRYLIACIGASALAIGFIISLFRKDRACLHDLLSHTSLRFKPNDEVDKPQN